MKTKLFVLILTVVLGATAQVSGWAQAKYQPKQNEEIYGTWIVSIQLEYRTNV